MKTKNLRHITLSLFAVLCVCVLPVHALTVICPVNKTNECGAALTFDDPSYTNGCCPTVTVTVITNYSSVSACYSTYTREWSVSDCCTNYACSQTITVVDKTPPVIICASDKTVPCGSNWQFDLPSAFDLCCPSNSLFYQLISTNVVRSTPCETILGGVWRVTDCCNNFTTCTQQVTVVNSLAPVIQCPTNKTVTAGTPWNFDDPVLLNTCCSNNVILVDLGTTTNGYCPKYFTHHSRLIDCCTNGFDCYQVVTVVSNCTNCITITCPDNIRLPCASFTDTPVTWTNSATNTCIPNDLVVWSVPPPGFPFGIGNTPVMVYASNSLGEVQTCTFNVEIFPRSPRMSARRGSGGFGPNSLLIDYAQTCGEFAIEWGSSLSSIGSGGGSDWSPISGLPTGSWGQPNQTNNTIVERIIGFDLPDVGDPSPFARFFRLSSEVRKGRDFSSIPSGPWLNPPSPVLPLSFSRSDNGMMQVVDLGNTHGLLVNDVGIVANFAGNNLTWPARIYGPPQFHEAELWVVGYINGPQHSCWFAEAFDTAGRLVDAIMDTNSPSMVTLRSRGLPLHHIKLWTEPNEPVGLVALKARIDYTLAMGQFGDCLDFTTYSTNTVVPNPCELLGHTIGSTNVLGMVEPSTYIEAGPDGGPDGFGNGYHVEYSATVSFPTNCCTTIHVELVAYSEDVVVEARDGAGTLLESYPVPSGTMGTVVNVELPPSEPICRVVVRAPGGRTRILRICCLPSKPPITTPSWIPGTNSNPLVLGPLAFQVSVGQSWLLNTIVLAHNNSLVLELGNETVATLATACDKVVLEVFSENPNNGMELEAADVNGFVVARGGSLEESQSLQTVVLSGNGIKTIRFKCPAAQGYLKAFYGLP